MVAVAPTLGIGGGGMVTRDGEWLVLRRANERFVAAQWPNKAKQRR